jgi:hypothetical protein
MKLPIKKEYFDAIKKSKKDLEFRDAHITFVCEETGETLLRYVEWVDIIPKTRLEPKLQNSGLFEDDRLIMFKLSKDKVKGSGK